MPLNCLKDGEPYFSFRTETHEWRELKQHYRDVDLRMACCGKHAIPKNSVLGTPFFAHRPRQQCSSGESAAHLNAKFQIAEAASAIGDWQVGTEVAGKTPDGEAWQADVLCTRGTVQVAFEVQLSQQSLGAYSERQERYVRAGVRGCWLAAGRHGSSMCRQTRSDHGLPIFGLNLGGGNGDTVTVDQEPDSAAEIPLATFVRGALCGDLAFIEFSSGLQDAYIDLVPSNCWRCKNPIRIVRSYRANYAREYECIYLDGARYPGQLSAAIDRLRRTDNRITPVGRRYSKTIGSRYFAASCPVCRALQGRHFMFTEHGVATADPTPISLRFGSDELPEARWIWRPAFEVPPDT